MHIRTALVIALGLVAIAIAITYRLMVVTVTFDVYLITGGLSLAGLLTLFAAWALEMQLRTEPPKGRHPFAGLTEDEIHQLHRKHDLTGQG